MSVRFGLIGFGAWGQHHADAIAQSDGGELVAIAGRGDESVARAREAYPGVDVVADYRDLLARGDIDAVDIVVPSDRHHEIAAAALAAGKHVLLEKPMAIAAADCDDLVRMAAERDRLLVVGHELRLSSLWGQAKRLIDDGYLGTPLYALVELSRNPYRLGSGGWRFDIDRVGDWILEEPIHFFDLARWYLGTDPTSVYAAANSRQPDHPELQDNFSAIMHFDGGAYAVVSQTLAAFEHHQTVKVTGTGGALWASWSGAMDRTRHATYSLRGVRGTGRDEPVETFPIDRPTGELFELEDQANRFVAAIEGRAAPHCTAEDGRWSVRMCLAAAESVRAGRAVEL